MNEPPADTSTAADNNNGDDNDIGLVGSEAPEGIGIQPDIMAAHMRKLAEEYFEFKDKYDAMLSHFQRLELDNKVLKHRLADMERAIAGDRFAMDNVMFRHMCNVATSAIYNGLCAAFLQTDLQSLPQAILCKESIVDWKGEVQDSRAFWERIPYLFEMELVQTEAGSGTKRLSIYEVSLGGEGTHGRIWHEYKGERTGKLFYLEFNAEVTSSDWLRVDATATANLAKFLRNMRTRIHRQVKKHQQDLEEVQSRFTRYEEDAGEIRNVVDELAKVANQHRKEMPVFDVNYWIEEYRKKPFTAPRADRPVPDGRRQTYIRNTLLAQREIAHNLVPKLKSLEEMEEVLDGLDEKLSRMGHYLYLTTIALQLVRDKDIAAVLSDPDNVIKKGLTSFGNAFPAHPLNYRPRVQAAVNRLYPSHNLTERERELVTKLGSILRTDPPDSIHEFGFWPGETLPSNARSAFQIPPGQELHYYSPHRRDRPRRDRGFRELNLMPAASDGYESPPWPHLGPVSASEELEPVAIAPESSYGPPPPSSPPHRLPNEFTPPVSVGIGLPVHPLGTSLAYGQVLINPRGEVSFVSSSEDSEDGQEAGEGGQGERNRNN